MTFDILKILKLILYCIPFVLICLVSTKLNFKKEHRYKQVFLPIIALLYCTLAVIFLNDITDLILKGIYWLIEHVSFLAFLDKVNWAGGMVFIVNTVLVIGFMLVKGILFPMLMGLAKIPQLADRTSGKFYFVSDEDKKNGITDVRYLKSKFGDAKKIIKAMYFAMLAVFALLLIITDYMTSYKVFSAPFYPAFGIIVLGEIVFFLSGKTLEEKEEEEPTPDDEEPDEEIDYDLIPKKYEDIFPGRVIKKSGAKATARVSESANALLEKYQREYGDTLCQEAGLMYTYYSSLAEAGHVLDEAYLRQTRNILDGKSVIFFTRFYTDTTEYVFLPVVRALMKRGRILVILGQGGNVGNIKQWFTDGIASINGFEGIWKIDPLSKADDDTSVAVIYAKNIYNQKLLNEKSRLLAETSMVFIVEAGSLLGTLQLGLCNLVSYLRRGGNDPQYIIYDRNCDGLVDSISHVLNKSLVQVNATAVGTAKKNTLFWKADGRLLHHKLGLTSSRYLGVGTELALVALKAGVSKVTWASSRKFPVTDMSWIASQYYPTLCRAAGLNVSQNELSEHLEYVSDPQSLPKTDHSFLVVEDEYNNAFEVARQFATRGKKQSFVNVLSQNYLLRQYMADNVEIFEHDPKAVPNITADYQRGARNTVYKLIMRMIEGPVEEEEIRDALDIIGEDTDKVYQSLRSLILKYFFPTDGGENAEKRLGERIDNALSVQPRTEIDPCTMRAEKKRYYYIGNQHFVDTFLSQLKIVYYLAEDEHDKNNFLDSAMYGHVHQKYLPGMMITVDGKHYQVVSMTKNSGIIVRRAADHINARRYYRTLRRYTLDFGDSKDYVGSKKTYGGITVEHAEANIKVDTFGYLDMSDYSNIKNAKRVELSNIEPREYRSKECIKIRMEGSTPDVRVTVATLLNELFVTVFPDSYQYITATAPTSDAEEIKGYMPELCGGEDDCIYIIEDSLIDLGLLINVDRYFTRFLEIICDVLNWHREKLEDESKAEEGGEDGPEHTDDSAEDDTDEPQQENVDDDTDDSYEPNPPFKKLKKKLHEWKKKRKKRKEEKKKLKEERKKRKQKGESGESSGSRTPVMPLNGNLIDKNDNTEDIVEVEDTEYINDDDSGSSVEEDLPYSKSHFLLYGYEEVPKILDLVKTEEYLTVEFGDNYLKQTRESRKPRKQKYYNYVFEEGKHYCDFCGTEIVGMPNVLPDGRESCPECSKTAVLKAKDFKKLYKKTRKEMEQIFGIKLKSRLAIKVWDAHKIAEAFGETFTPTPKCDYRYLGFAIRNTNPAVIALESGAPEIEIAKTLIHEMTHVWQYENLPDIFKPVKDNNAVEGMAVWAEVQYLVSRGLKDRANEYAEARSRESTEYGIGFLMYRDKFPIQDKPQVHKKTPFNCRSNPLL